MSQDPCGPPAASEGATESPRNPLCMPRTLPFILVSDLELIIYGIGFLIFVAGSVSNAFKKAAGNKKNPHQEVALETLEEKIRELFGQPDQRPASRPAQSDLERLAEQQRRRLRELARRQANAQSAGPNAPAASPQRPGSARPFNAPQPPPLRSTARPKSARSPQRPMPPRPAARTTLQHPAPPPRRPSVAPHTQSPPRQDEAEPIPQPAAPLSAETSLPSRHPSDLASSFLPSTLTTDSLRQALIFKEILDPPVALRDL